MTDLELSAAVVLLKAKTVMVEAENSQRARNGYAPAYQAVDPDLEDAIEKELKRREVLKS